MRSELSGRWRSLGPSKLDPFVLIEIDIMRGIGVAAFTDGAALKRFWCGRPDLNRHRSFDPTDFLTTSAFAAAHRAFVVWTIPSPWRFRVRCCPSSLYTFPFPGLARDCRLQVSPNLSSSASAVSHRALNRLSPLRLPFRHARAVPRILQKTPRFKCVVPDPRLKHSADRQRRAALGPSSRGLTGFRP